MIFEAHNLMFNPPIATTQELYPSIIIKIIFILPIFSHNFVVLEVSCVKANSDPMALENLWSYRVI